MLDTGSDGGGLAMGGRGPSVLTGGGAATGYWLLLCREYMSAGEVWSGQVEVKQQQQAHEMCSVAGRTTARAAAAGGREGPAEKGPRVVWRVEREAASGRASRRAAFSLHAWSLCAVGRGSALNHQLLCSTSRTQGLLRSWHSGQRCSRTGRRQRQRLGEAAASGPVDEGPGGAGVRRAMQWMEGSFWRVFLLVPTTSTVGERLGAGIQRTRP
ncbi:hypothetical protein K491DRAFT_406590 [Lophiostoma macrostomum CBS 122681]|uniref:Uncharacterized protein n=1 Tax=Lophiostoma macrostomum CBS 122681 TaxID=1314788 RepID=A0A6A6SGH2_9PLEO|nr:hypothetical protein K491DRAFT_406590 [Lophiostoma macrostomum CBS 122681]